MNRGFRTVSGACILLALGLSLAEGAWAAVCALEMETEMAGMEMPDASAADAHDQHAPHCGGNHHGDDPADQSPAGAPDCPLGIPAGSCASSATLPTATLEQPHSFFEHDVPPTSLDVLPNRLIGTAVFHPPKA